MNKSLLLSMSIFFILSTTLMAEDKKTTTKSSAKSSEKVYVGFGFGFTDVSSHDTGYSLILNAGKSLPKVNEDFGVEGAFTRTIVDPSFRNRDLSITTLAGYATYNFKLTPEVDLRAKGGILYERLATTITEDGFEVSFGFKVLYALESKKSLYLDYTVIEKDIAIFSVGLQF